MFKVIVFSPRVVVCEIRKIEFFYIVNPTHNAPRPTYTYARLTRGMTIDEEPHALLV